MEKHTSYSSNWNKNSKKNTIRLFSWTFAWVTTLAIATFGRLYIWEDNETISLIAILFNLVIGIGFIIANKDHLKGLDELQQKIQLEATALSLVVGVVTGITYSLLAQAKIVHQHAEISNLIIIMGLTYSIGIFIGNRRYK
ncbi:MAG: hypothetical protein KKF62_00265 [Bacteroidetes bacterium]|nr:hypothetical protein [Bacteroidota bacterium]MBU1114650.1 hypothetical protein [Bacteroidota bacterium]MBU1798194.1 hypothetical protein [Bacteroidota bacterium]